MYLHIYVMYECMCVCIYVSYSTLVKEFLKLHRICLFKIIFKSQIHEYSLSCHQEYWKCSICTSLHWCPGSQFQPQHWLCTLSADALWNSWFYQKVSRKDPPKAFLLSPRALAWCGAWSVRAVAVLSCPGMTGKSWLFLSSSLPVVQVQALGAYGILFQMTLCQPHVSLLLPWGCLWAPGSFFACRILGGDRLCLWIPTASWLRSDKHTVISLEWLGEKPGTLLGEQWLCKAIHDKMRSSLRDVKIKVKKKKGHLRICEMW